MFLFQTLALTLSAICLADMFINLASWISETGSRPVVAELLTDILGTATYVSRYNAPFHRANIVVEFELGYQYRTVALCSH